MATAAEQAIIEKARDKRMKICVIGSGAAGQRHSKNLINLGHDIELISWRKNSHNISKLIKKGNADYIIICTGTNVRRQLFELCYEEEIPFFVEKPVAYKKDDLDWLYKLPAEYLIKCNVGFMQRYSSIAMELKKLVRKPVINMNIDFGHDVNKWRKNWVFANSYAAQMGGGGVVLDLCHDIDLINTLTGAKEVRRVVSIDNAKHQKVDLCSIISMKTKSGGEAKLSLDYIRNIPVHKGTILMESKTIEFDFLNGIIAVDKESNTGPCQMHAIGIGCS